MALEPSAGWWLKRDVNFPTASTLSIGQETRGAEFRRAELGRPVWAASLTVELDGFRYELRSTSETFVRALTKRLRLPVVDGRPDVVYSAVIPTVSPGETPELCLYSGRRLVVRTLSMETLTQALLEELRASALISATDRVYLRVPTIWHAGVGVLLPSRASNQLVEIERAAAKAGIDMTSSQAVVLDLRYGRPVHQFRPSAKEFGRTRIDSVDVIATPVGTSGAIPSKEDVLFELAQQTLNLPYLGQEGLRALTAMVERTDLIEWDETRPAGAIEPLVRDGSAARIRLS